MGGAAGRSWIGIDLGGTKTLALALDDAGRVIAERDAPTAREEGVEAVLGRAVALARSLVLETAPPHGVGAGFAGLVDHASGRVLSSVVLPGWNDVPLAARLRAAFGVPAAIENDATCAGIGEHASMPEPPAASLFVATVGTGIGGAHLVDGRPLVGTGTAGELGHTTIDPDGPECWCGNRGCLHVFASGTAIGERAAVLSAAHPDSPLHGRSGAIPLEEVAAAAEAGDEAAAHAIRAGARAFGVGLANVVNLLAPERVALCGGVVEIGERWLAPVLAEARRRAMPEPFARATIGRAIHGPRSGAVGAAWLGRRASDRDAGRAEGT